MRISQKLGFFLLSKVRGLAYTRVCKITHQLLPSQSAPADEMINTALKKPLRINKWRHWFRIYCI